jgi:hypothetical protein
MEKSQKSVKVRDRLNPIKHIPQAANFQNFIKKIAIISKLGGTLIKKKSTHKPLTINKSSFNTVFAARWCSGQAYRALDPTTRVRISHGLPLLKL